MVMKNPYPYKITGLIWLWPVLMMVLTLPPWGCSTQEPPLSPGAASFKKEVKDCINKASLDVMEPLFKENIKAIHEALKTVEPEAIKLCRMCPFLFGILDPKGDTLAVYPKRENTRANFSSYAVVVQTLKNRRINQQRFFMPNGSQLYIVCVPLVREGKMLGLLALAVDAAEAQKRWGITEQEFQVLDFNQ
jgi:hypothetical protein